MSEILLFVSESLANESFENCKVVLFPSGWPVMSELRRAKPIPSAFLAATSSMDADSVRQMLKTLATMPKADRRLVFADDAIPADLRAGFPAPMIALLQRPMSCDLMCVATAVAQQAASSNTMLQTLLGGDRETDFVSALPCVDRFPQVSEMQLTPNSGVDSAALKSAIDRALSGVKISTFEQKCISAGILLLWDFLNDSHEISQTMEGRGTPRTADYWHGIMHRREPDAGNAAYWFRRVGKHPAFESLAMNLDGWMAETGASEEEKTLARKKVATNGSFDPFAMIELSTIAMRFPAQLEDDTLRRMQYLEMLNLLSWSIGA